MTKQKILLLIPLTIVAGLLVYSWATILFTDVIATWRHYVALGLFAALIFLFFKSLTKSVLATGLYFIIGTCNLLTLTPSVTTNSYGLRIGSAEIWTPSFQLLSFGLLVLYFILNFDTLTNIYLDYKETRQAKNKNP
jgi:hypothetical protein